LPASQLTHRLVAVMPPGQCEQRQHDGDERHHRQADQDPRGDQQRWFGEQLPAVETRVARPRESWVDDPELRAAIVADGDAAVLGVGV